MRRVQFGPPGDEPVESETVLIGTGGAGKKAKSKKKDSGGTPEPRQKKEKVKIDPQLVAQARELRDRYLEMLNSGQIPGGLPETRGKYAIGVSRKALPAPGGVGDVASLAPLPSPLPASGERERLPDAGNVKT